VPFCILIFLRPSLSEKSPVRELLSHNFVKRAKSDFGPDVIMYYRRRQYRSRRKYRYRRGRKTTSGTARAAYAVAKRTQAITRPESKYVDSDSTNNFDNTAGVFTLLNGMIQSTGASGRIGKVIGINGLWASIRFEMAAGAFNSSARFIVFLDKQPNGAAVSQTTLLATPAVVTYSDMPFNIDNRKRFKIICDKRFRMSAGDSTIVFVRKFFKLSIKTIYNAGNTGTVTDINTNALYWAIFTDQTAGANAPGYSISTRMRYFDA